LKTFSKISLAAGETREISLDLPARAFAFWDDAARCWRVEAGVFRIEAGFSAADIRDVAEVVLGANTMAP
jgi:beta-glucosidase